MVQIQLVVYAKASDTQKKKRIEMQLNIFKERANKLREIKFKQYGNMKPEQFTFTKERDLKELIELIELNEKLSLIKFDIIKDDNTRQKLKELKMIKL